MLRLAPILLCVLIATPVSAQDFEVWLVDQSDSFGKTYGGTIHIYEGSQLNGAAADAATPIDVLDLGGATAERCMADTGVNPQSCRVDVRRQRTRCGLRCADAGAGRLHQNLARCRRSAPGSRRATDG